MSKKKKIILLVSMVLVLVVAAIINISLLTEQNKPQDGGNDVVPSGSFFTTYRSDRQEARSYEIKELDSILALQGEEYEQARQDAANQKLQLVSITETELLLETLLKAQGFEDAVVSIGTTSENINVIVSSDELSREDTAKIYSIITSETTTSTDYIRILSI